MATVRVTKEMAEQAVRDTNWDKIDAMTDEDIDEQIAADPDPAPISDGPGAMAARLRWVRKT
ncbi:hypothetical protein ACFQX4_23600 [Roseomonas sp. GCM10028921]